MITLNVTVDKRGDIYGKRTLHFGLEHAGSE